MGLSRNKVAVSEGAAGSPPFYGERVKDSKKTLAYHDFDGDLEDGKTSFGTHIVQFSVNGKSLLRVSVTNAEGPPVPIPNTEVKLCSGENTLRETAREDNSMLTSEERAERSALLTERNRRWNYNLYKWGCSSAGRAPALQAGGHGFESHHLHQPSEAKITY